MIKEELDRKKVAELVRDIQNELKSLRTVLRSGVMGKCGLWPPGGGPGSLKSTPDPPRPPFRWWRGFGSGVLSTARPFIPPPSSEQRSITRTPSMAAIAEGEMVRANVFIAMLAQMRRSDRDLS